MAGNDLKHVARRRINESFGPEYALGADGAEVVDAFVEAFAGALERGCLVILDSQIHVIHFRHGHAKKADEKAA
jgi:hypothetical protein